ncbi:glycerate kinase type-2 family protein [Gayadomonas joobiniege]|uniref:glycerate kinase type-2 family protein n=1 Tax=Gayadomonas joobiniege TaxID=1234606 RepID=UPI00037C5C05|nr:DUF4147 domain-containing protein [Gayadomonas joobiniege]
MIDNPKAFLTDLFTTAYTACKAEYAMPEYLKKIQVKDKVCILGAGKAAAEMAAAAYQYYGDKCYGAVVTRYGYETDKATGAIEVLTASHPAPDENSLKAGRYLLQLAAEAPADVPVVFLISGGGSALACVPAEGLSFSEKLKVHKFLVKSGASINQINVVRKHLSGFKGGKLAAACRGQLTSLILSDVVGDDLSIIASGPTVSDPSEPSEALAILKQYQYPITAEIEAVLQRPADPALKQLTDTQNYLIGNANVAIDAGAVAARAQGLETQIISYEVEGDAQAAAKAHLPIVEQALAQNKTLLLLSGGELTVTATGSLGEGGPNQEYVLALAIALQGKAGVYALACDTDGVDGSQDVAGAYIDPTSLQRASAAGVDAQAMLAAHDSYHFFKAIDDLIISGPTNTNVNDFRAILVVPS